jgi:hypothetical protein
MPDCAGYAADAPSCEWRTPVHRFGHLATPKSMPKTKSKVMIYNCCGRDSPDPRAQHPLLQQQLSRIRFSIGATGNTVSFNLPAGTNEQYLQLVFTANTGWTAAQFSEFAVFPGSGSGCVSSAPAAPTALSATAASSSQVKLSWTASTTGGVTYSAFRSTANGFSPSTSNQVASGVMGTTYSGTALTASTTYYYIVQAVNCAGTAASSQGSATTPSGTTVPSAPTGLTATAGNASVSLSWTASTASAMPKTSILGRLYIHQNPVHAHLTPRPSSNPTPLPTIAVHRERPPKF